MSGVAVAFPGSESAPGPGFWPTMRSLPLSRRGVLALFEDWARRYGDVCCYRTLRGPVCLLSSPRDVEEVLVNQARSFRKGRGSQLNRRLLGNGLLTSDGPTWIRQRRLMQPAFHPCRLFEYAGAMTSYTARMLDRWRPGERRNLHVEMTRLTLEIVLKILFHTEISDFSEKIDPIIDQILEQDERSRLAKVVQKVAPGPAAVRYLFALRRLDRFVFEQIAERRRTGGSGDLLSILLSARDEDGKTMSDQQVRDEVMTFVGAGYETTALTLCYTLYLLSQYPEVEARLVEELRAVLGGRPPAPEDVPRLVYTEAVIKESMRLYPPGWAISRDATEPVELGGRRFPAGTCFFLNLWGIHRDPRYYERPERFEPERWTPEFSRQLPKYAYFPFGGGQRMCIGAAFAKLESVLILASIVQKFRMSPAPGWQLRLNPAVVLRPKGGVPMDLEYRG